jgi:hypothetical protein
VASTPALPSLGSTARRDRWWLAPLATGVGLGAFAVYSAIVALHGVNYRYEEDGASYLSPFFSPDLESIFNVDLPFSPAILVLWAPLGLRATCYYYRKAYYRSYFLSPPACAVAGRKGYSGESRFPLILQNSHRYFLYAAIVVLGFLWYDAGRAFVFETADGRHEFGIGLGSLVLLLNVVCLSAFTFGCNSLRHLVGGRLDCFSCSRSARVRGKAYLRIGRLNVRHFEWAWISLATVALADLYIRLAASGVFDDPRII